MTLGQMRTLNARSHITAFSDDCEHGHPKCADRDGGACLVEILHLMNEASLELQRKKVGNCWVTTIGGPRRRK